ncbi:MAG: DUF222 domain-containing protein [Actinomycetota bacterium]
MFDTRERDREEDRAFAARRDSARRREGELREAIARLNAATAEVVSLVGEIEADQSWGDHGGCLSMTHLLSWQCGVGRRDARRWVSVAKKLSELPATSAAFEEGRLSLTQVESIARVATPQTDSSYLRWASLVTAEQLDQLSRTERRCKRLQTEAAEEKHRNRFLYTNFDDDGSYRISGRLSADTGALIDRALDRAQDELFREASRNQEPALDESWGARRADALVQLAESALSSVGTRSGGDATQVVLHLTPDMLRASEEPTDGDSDARCELEPGVGILSETARRLACDCSLVAMVEDRDGNPLDLGRKTRVVSPALRRALNARDGCCRWPGCGQSRFRDAHHLEFWGEDEGETKIENLASLCRRHHRMVHEGGFGVKRRVDGTLSFTDPWGRELPDAPELKAAGESARRSNDSGDWRSTTRPAGPTGTEARSTPTRWT